MLSVYYNYTIGSLLSSSSSTKLRLISKRPAVSIPQSYSSLNGLDRKFNTLIDCIWFWVIGRFDDENDWLLSTTLSGLYLLSDGN
jgi:hypothetical protein